MGSRGSLAEQSNGDSPQLGMPFGSRRPTPGNAIGTEVPEDHAGLSGQAARDDRRMAERIESPYGSRTILPRVFRRGSSGVGTRKILDALSKVVEVLAALPALSWAGRRVGVRAEQDCVFHPVGSVEPSQPLGPSQLTGVGQVRQRTHYGIIGVRQAADDRGVLERAVADHIQKIGRVGSGDYLDATLFGLVFDEVEQQPLSGRVNPVVDLLEHVEAAGLGPSSVASIASSRSVPSDAA